MSGDDKVTKLLRTYLWEIQREKRGDIYRERGNIEILKINIEHHTPHNATHHHTPLRQFRCITISFISLKK